MNRDESTTAARLDQALAEYVRRVEAGAPLDHAVLFAEFPDVADQLRGCLGVINALDDFFPAEVAEHQPLADTRKLTVAESDGPAAPDSVVPRNGRVAGGSVGSNPRRFGDYELLEEIARGGMGIVYRARQLAPIRVVALKMMLPFLSLSEGLRRRFRIESDVIARLDHPGILPVYEVSEQDGIPWFSMKFAEGGSLAKRLPALRGEWREIAGLVASVAGAIQYAHEQGILHRDLKPGNVLFDARGEPMIADFGLAKYRAIDQNLTLPSTVLGSPHYLAPEMVDESLGPVGPAVDIYGLGAILYELLTGQPPIVGDDAYATLRLLPTRRPARGTALDPSIPPALDAIACRCLEKRPADRYATAGEVAADLGRWLAGGSLKSGSPRWHPIRSGTIAVVLLCAIAVLGWAWHRSVKPSAESESRSSLAVLKFVDDGPSTDLPPFGAGFAADLTERLSGIANLKVAAQQAAFRIGSTAADVSTAIRDLGVTHVLIGHVRAQSGRVHVDAELVRGNLGTRVWSATYDRPSADLLSIRDALVADVRGALGVGKPLQNPASTAESENAEAYRIYLICKSLYAIGTSSREMRGKMVVDLQRAVELDPKFARAWALLSLYQSSRAAFADIDPGSGFAEARQAALRAIELDPLLGAGYRALAKVHLLRDWDWDAAHEAIGKALALEPNDPWTLRVAAQIADIRGESDEAERLGRLSVASDPYDTNAFFTLGMNYMKAGRDADAVQALRRSLQLYPGHPYVWMLLGTIELTAGRPDSALEMFSHEIADTRAWGQAIVYEVEGRRAEADAALARYEHQYDVDPNNASAYLIAEIYGLRGDATGAMAWLERSYADREELSSASSDRFLHSIAQDRRYLAFLERLHLRPVATLAIPRGAG